VNEPTLTIQQAFDQGLAHHQAGRLSDAEHLYRRILATMPEHYETLHLLGVLAMQVGRSDVAVEYIGAALKHQPKAAVYLSNMGSALNNLGRHREAAINCANAIRAKPDYTDAHINLALALKGEGRLDEAAVCYREALRQLPESTGIRINLGNLLFEQKKIAEARALFEEVLKRDPKHADAHNGLGVLAFEEHNLEQAERHYREAVRLNPNLASGHSNLGLLLRDINKLDEAEFHCREAIRLDPKLIHAHGNLGLALADRNRFEDAEVHYSDALALKPDFTQVSANLAISLYEQGRYAECAAQARHALSLDPKLAQAHNSLAAALFELGEVEEAQREAQLGPELQPKSPLAARDYALLLRDWGMVEEAIVACREAIRRAPDNPEGHVNLAGTLLLNGELEEGWQEYEWRQRSYKSALRSRHFLQPQWKGERLNGRTLLIYSEQGLGDNIQFVRYVPMIEGVLEPGARVILAAPKGLMRLFRDLHGIERLMEIDKSLPPFDLHCPMLSLPLAFGTTVETIPGDVPYLSVDPQEVAAWRERLAALPGLKIGIAWRGNKLFSADRRRSIAWETLAPLGQVPGITLISLDKREAGAPELPPLDGMTLHDWTDELQDFAATGALVEALDLVISVDTAIAHLAGALAKPVWLLNRFASDWRWLREREDSPWYPSLRIFRQARAHDWQSVISRVADELTQFSARRPKRRNGRTIGQT
jgi:Flp pilus assembly protein TadD